MTRQADEVGASASGDRRAVSQAPLSERVGLGRAPVGISSVPTATGAFARFVQVLHWAALRHEVIRSVDDLPDDLRSEIGVGAGTCLRRPRGEQE